MMGGFDDVYFTLVLFFILLNFLIMDMVYSCKDYYIGRCSGLIVLGFKPSHPPGA